MTVSDPFVNMLKSATKNSSKVTTAENRSSTRRVRGSRKPTTDSKMVRLQLSDIDGMLQWEETTGAMPDLGQFRSRRAGKPSKEAAIADMSFERLPPSKITQFLAGKDDDLTPLRGIRRYDPKTQKLKTAEIPSSGNALLFVHGTFSNSENLIGNLLDTQAGIDFLAAACKKYKGNVFTFDHPTLAVGPLLNAMDLHRHLDHSGAKLDLVCHSRGGLVGRWWCEAFDPHLDRCGKIILAGSPLAGTGLASPHRIRETIHLLTQIGKALQLTTGLAARVVPVLSVVEVLLKVATSVARWTAKSPAVDAAMAMVPGLFGMSRVGNNPELLRLLSGEPTDKYRYYAIQSNFETTSDPAWQFWKWFRPDKIKDKATDALFGGPNDLVVDTESMSQLAKKTTILRRQTLDFGDSPIVHHLNYFQQPETVAFLEDMLL